MRLLAVVIVWSGSVTLFAAEPLLTTCFNDSDATNKLGVGVWTFEGHGDWKTARAAVSKDHIPGTFVFSFLPGHSEYSVAELGYCFYMPPGKPGPMVRCQEGKLVISELRVPTVLVGMYDFTLKDGERKALRFRASYCPKAPS